MVDFTVRSMYGSGARDLELPRCSSATHWLRWRPTFPMLEWVRNVMRQCPTATLHHGRGDHPAKPIRVPWMRKAAWKAVIVRFHEDPSMLNLALLDVAIRVPELRRRDHPNAKLSSRRIVPQALRPMIRTLLRLARRVAARLAKISNLLRDPKERHRAPKREMLLARGGKGNDVRRIIQCAPGRNAWQSKYARPIDQCVKDPNSS